MVEVRLVLALGETVVPGAVGVDLVGFKRILLGEGAVAIVEGFAPKFSTVGPRSVLVETRSLSSIFPSPLLPWKLPSILPLVVLETVDA